MSTDTKEPRITVNGVELSEGQAMTVRVALSTFCSEMGRKDALGKGEHGQRMATAYRERAGEVLRVMIAVRSKDEGGDK